MKSIHKVLRYTGSIASLHKETKRAWAEYFEMEKRIKRLEFYLRLYHVFVLGFLFAMVLDKIGS